MKFIKVAGASSDGSFFSSLDQNGQFLVLVGVYFGVISVIAFIAFAMDKQRAMRGDWRISEARLLLLAFIGGAFGAKLGQVILRHKTRKEPFRTHLQTITILNVFVYFVALPVFLFMR